VCDELLAFLICIPEAEASNRRLHTGYCALFAVLVSSSRQGPSEFLQLTHARSFPHPSHIIMFQSLLNSKLYNLTCCHRRKINRKAHTVMDFIFHIYLCVRFYIAHREKGDCEMKRNKQVGTFSAVTSL